MPAASGKWEKRHVTLLNEKWLTIHCSMHLDEHHVTELELIVIKNLVQKAWFSKVFSVRSFKDGSVLQV